MTFCLPKFAADAFKAKLVSGEIDPGKLSDMSSAERREFFKGFLGEENAKQVNSLFESKLLLKNQQQGIINWAKSVAGLKPEIMRDLVAKVENMTEALKPADEKRFLADLAEKRLGVGVSAEEAGNIVDLANRVRTAKDAIATGGDRLDYGRAEVSFDKYVGDLKNEALKTSILEKLKHPLDTTVDIAGQAKSIKASLDLSAIFRQGWRTMFTHPSIWFKNSLDAFSNAVKSFGGKAVMDEVNADIRSRPNALNNFYKRAKLAVGVAEEAIPQTPITEKIPVIGRAFKASEESFNAFQKMQRADIFDKYIEAAQKAGVDLDTQRLQGLGKLVNSLTMRGNLGPLEPVANVVNNVFFSPRAVMSHVDFLTAHAFDPNVDLYVKKLAAQNLAKVVIGTASIMLIANALKPGSVEFDPRSSDFGQIRIGDTRFNITGGMNSVATLASRIALQSTKSSTTHKINKLNTGKFGAETGGDIIGDFFSNKLSPAFSVFKEMAINHKDFDGNKPTLLGEAQNLFAPLPFTNALEAHSDPKAANLLAVLIADGLGIATNTYGAKKK